MPIVAVDANLSTLEVELPRTHTGIVLAQPHLELTPQEPYRCTEQSKPAQLEAIDASLEVARTASHGAGRTHFTIFPEYSIPAPEGVDRLENALREEDWPVQTIVVGGTDGLSAMEYRALAEAPGTHVDMEHNNPADIPTGQWINCAIIWAKGADGSVERWLQPKLSPSWSEQDVADSTMFRGGSIFTFRGHFNDKTPYRFSVLVCFDWIATVEGETPWRAMVDELSRQATEELSLSWLFVIQHNRRPSHESFMTEVNGFFNHTAAANVRRDRTCLVFANTAGRPEPGSVESYGHTSLILPEQTRFRMPKCYGTFSSGGPRFRRHAVIGHHKDCLFRERGACVHSVKQVNPDALRGGAAGRTIALQNPFVHPLGGRNDPRTPANIVPASVKWLNDELDTTPRLTSLAPTYQHVFLADRVDVDHDEVVDSLRENSRESAGPIVRLASPTITKQNQDDEVGESPNADNWGDAERNAVQHVVHTISILRQCTDGCTVSNASVHATLSIAGRECDLVAVRGDTHERCREHYIRELPAGRRPVLLVSRDVDNNEWLQRLGSYIEAATGTVAAERRFTDPAEISCHLGYRDLLTIFVESETVHEAKERFNDKLSH